MFCVGFFHLSILVGFFCGALCGVRSVLGFFFSFCGFFVLFFFFIDFGFFFSFVAFNVI